jgi:hypothetical protein
MMAMRNQTQLVQGKYDNISFKSMIKNCDLQRETSWGARQHGKVHAGTE